MGPVIFGVVVDNVDPDKLGRVQVRLQDFSGDVTLPWIPVLQPLVGKVGDSTWFMPEADDHVVVLCGPGGTDGMVCIGSVHSGKIRKPLALGLGAAGDPLVRGIKTPAGNEIVLTDTKGKETILIRTKDGKVSLTFDGKETSMLIDVEADLKITAKANVIIDCDAATVKTKGDATVTAKGDVTVKGAKVAIKGDSEVTVSSKSIKLG